MQRIISLEASRSSNLTSEFVTKRLCCSFILTVAFFAVIGGFFLGRFAEDRNLQKLKTEISEISKKVTALDTNLKNTFHNSSNGANCMALSTKPQCEHWMSYSDSQRPSVKSLLDKLIDCFNNG